MRQIIINFSNRALYTLVAMMFVVLFGIGVYAYANPETNVGHDYSEIKPCEEGQFLTISGGSWSCVTVTETDPTILESVKDGINWSEIDNIPPGFADGIDDDTSDILSCSFTDCTDYEISLIPTSSFWGMCPDNKPVLKGFRQDNYAWGSQRVVAIDYMRCCSIICS